MNKKLKEKLDTWRSGPEGFIQWIKDIKPQIEVAQGGFGTFQLQPFQEEFIRGALELDEQGNFKHQIITVSMPRRHSKSTLCALLVLWRFTLMPTEYVVVLANSSHQATGVSFRLLRSILLNTPALRTQIGTENIQHGKIAYPALSNQIIPVSTSIASLYGKKITACWATELHSCPDPDVIDTMISSLGDSEGSMLLADSTTDSHGGKFHTLEQLAEQDERAYSYRIEYKDLAEAKEKSPAWISRKWLDTVYRNDPISFQSQHLNQRPESSSNLFPREALQQCKAAYPNKIDKEELEKMIQGKKYVCGGALDRSFMFSAHGDNTIWTTVARTSDDSGEATYYLLNQKKIFQGLSRSIKGEILDDNERYGLKNIVFESYNSQDLATWSVEEGLASELVHVTNTLKLSAFQELTRLVKEGRLLFPEELEDLEKEMRHFSYHHNQNGTIVFGSRRRKDDRIFSLLWSVYALRKQETIVYELDSIECRSISKHAPHCYLRGGDLILNCSQTCPAHIKTKQMYDQYKATNVESELTLPDFFHRLVKVTGSKQYKAM